MSEPLVTAAVITASLTLVGVILTILFDIFRKQSENRRHDYQLDIENRRAIIEENKLALELYNEREIRVFESRLECYPHLFSTLMPLEKRAISKLSTSDALKIETNIKESVYTKVSHCLSTDSFEASTVLRDSLILFSENKTTSEELGERRLDLLRSLHKDLGRVGYYLGTYQPLIEENKRFHDSVLQSEKNQID